jgi:hypothetical protein
MSEPKTFMQQLDEWTNDTIIVPFGNACFDGGEEEYHRVTADIQKAVREKVLESYRNGQQAGVTKPAAGFKPRQFKKP